jgi:hypothetical protein
MPGIRRRTSAARALSACVLAAFLTVGAAAASAAADEVEYGDDEVTISVTITELAPCVPGTPGCAGGGGVVDGGLASTGALLGTALGAGVLLVALGAGAYALGAYRRDPGQV